MSTTAPRANKFEETTVFTRAARREMSDLWFHGASRLETGDDDDDDVDSIIVKMKPRVEVSANVKPAPVPDPSPTPAPPPIPQFDFNIFEDPTTHVRKVQVASPPEPEVLPVATKPMFDVFEESSGAVAARLVPKEEKKRAPLALIGKIPDAKEIEEDVADFKRPLPRKSLEFF